MNRSCFSCRLLAAGCLILASTAVAAADNWPQWRGPDNDGSCKETQLPVEWSATKNVVWKLAMPGMAGSTPVVWGERIFLTSADGNDLVLLCVSTAGKELWKPELAPGGTVMRRNARDQAPASPRPDGSS